MAAEKFKRRLNATLGADVEGYSRLMRGKEPRMTRMRRLLGFLLAIAFCVQTSCAPVRPVSLAQPDRRYLGRVSVVAARFDPDYQFEALTTGKGDAAGKGALTGALACSEFLKGGGNVIGALLFVACLPVGATVGVIAGASHAAPAQQIDEASAAVQRGIAALDLQNEVADAVVQYGQEMGIKIARPQQATGPTKPDDSPLYTQMQGITESVIEISVLHAKASTAGVGELRIALGMQARVRVLGTLDGKVIDTVFIKYTSFAHTTDEWLAADSQEIKTAFARGSTSIAEQAIDEIFLVYHPKDGVQQPPAVPGQSQTELVPPYALRGIEPPIRNKIYSPSRMTYGHLERYSLSELQPIFRWEPWPRGYDIVTGNGPDQADQVCYDFRIFGQEGIVYERRGIVDAEHRLEQPFEPCHTYRWTVRARFMLNDVPRATEWTGAYDTIGGSVAPWWWRRGSGVPALAMVPASVVAFYPIIETPSIDGKECPGR